MMLAPLVLLLVPAVWGGLEGEFGPRVPDDLTTVDEVAAGETVKLSFSLE